MLLQMERLILTRSIVLVWSCFIKMTASTFNRFMLLIPSVLYEVSLSDNIFGDSTQEKN